MKYIKEILKLAEKYQVKYSQDVSKMQSSTQKGDMIAAIIKSGILGIKGEVGNEQFDVNSPAANIIFGIFEKANFSGVANLSVTMDINKNITLTVVTNPNSQQVAAAIQNAFQSKLAAVLKRLPPPSETLIAQNIVTAQTA